MGYATKPRRAAPHVVQHRREGRAPGKGGQLRWFQQLRVVPAWLSRPSACARMRTASLARAPSPQLRLHRRTAEPPAEPPRQTGREQLRLSDRPVLANTGHKTHQAGSQTLAPPPARRPHRRSTATPGRQASTRWPSCRAGQRPSPSARPRCRVRRPSRSSGGAAVPHRMAAPPPSRCACSVLRTTRRRCTLSSSPASAPLQLDSS